MLDYKNFKVKSKKSNWLAWVVYSGIVSTLWLEVIHFIFK
jgi:hypothetical protein